VSLLLWERRSLAYVAEQAGHSIATLARYYAGVIKELEDEPRARPRRRSATRAHSWTGAGATLVEGMSARLRDARETHGL
jgi:hypothetical protein